MSLPLTRLLIFSVSVSLTRAHAVCLEDNAADVDEQGFFDRDFDILWDKHHIGWAIAGGAALLTTLISSINIYLHCTHYTKPAEQRQIVRILLMPPIYAIVSFFSYRYFREYIYYVIVRDAYEAFVIASFLILCLLYVGRSPLEQRDVMSRKEKTQLAWPFCCWRYRPSKPYFLFTVKWSVMQYVILRPLVSVIALITNAYGVYCGTSYNYQFANVSQSQDACDFDSILANEVWLTTITFVSVSVALYGLLVLYHLAKDDLSGHRPMMKFMSIKVAIFMVFYQGFLFSVLSSMGIIRATQFWTSTNISDGLNALCTTIEMVLISWFQLFAFSYTEYAILIKGSGPDRTLFWSSFWHSQDYRDFMRDISSSIQFFVDRWRGKAYTRSRYAYPQGTNNLDFQAAFGMDPGHRRVSQHTPLDAIRIPIAPPGMNAFPPTSDYGSDEEDDVGLKSAGPRRFH